ncbi:hypothetical protein ACLB2K_012210 [Fragaria x ananassa]
MAIKRLRTKWTPIQRETLEKAYSVEKTPSEATKEELSKQLELGYEQVTVWFMNRRAKDRRQGLVAKKSRMTRHQLATLEKTYASEKNPSVSKREEIGKKVGMSEIQVRLWYNKKRFEDQGKETKERKKRGPGAKKAPKSALSSSCDHLAFVSADLTGIPNPDTPCKSYTRCQNPNENWCCLCCKDVFCSVDLTNGHLFQHFKQTDHCLAVSCSDKSIWCYSCNSFLDAQAIPQLSVFSSSSNASGEPSSSSRLETPDASKDSSSSSRLENLDALMVDVTDLISKPSPCPNFHPLEDNLFVDQDKLAVAKKGLQKIFDCGLEALADPHIQEEFLAYSAAVLSVDSCPSDLKVILSSFRGNLSEQTCAFLQAQHELKVASDLSASITERRFVLRYHHSKYAEVKKQIIASDEKVANLKAMIKRLEASLAEEKSNREKIDRVLDSIETGVMDARDGLLSDIEQVSAMEGTTKAANQLVAQRHSAWENLRNVGIPVGIGFVLSCKDTLCSASGNRHMGEHYEQTDHCIAIHCSSAITTWLPFLVIPLPFPFLTLPAKGDKALSLYQLQVTARIFFYKLQAQARMGRSSSSKLESIDAIIVDVTDILSKRCPSIIDHPQLDAQSFVGQDELALAKEGLQKIFDCGLKALADPVVQEEFLFCSTTLLSAESCPSELKVKLSSFRCNLAEETSAFMKAQADLKVASDISSSITQKKFVVRQQTLKCDGGEERNGSLR